MKIVLTGGGTGGSVTPLAAIYQEINSTCPNTEFLFIGTKKGVPERQLFNFDKVIFFQIYSGKLRRYFDWRNFTDLFLILFGFFQSILILSKFKPDIIIGTGSFVSVPVIWAGWILRKKILIHQMDIYPSFSNVLLKRFANKITVGFEKSLKNFPTGRTILTGNPIRKNILNGQKEIGISKYKLNPKIPTLLVMGGGTGALNLNLFINNCLPELANFCQIIHLTGINKQIRNFNHRNYHPYKFIIEDMKDALAVSDLVISRAGMASLNEMSALSKPVILMPLPNSHQQQNAKFFKDSGAAIIIKENELTAKHFVKFIKKLLYDKSKLKTLSLNINKLYRKNADQAIFKEIFKLTNNGSK